jgi:hypothetical protein
MVRWPQDSKILTKSLIWLTSTCAICRTFQEGFLSKRMLVFTDRQVSFYCSADHWIERIGRPDPNRYAAPPHAFNLLLQMNFQRKMSTTSSIWTWNYFAVILEMYSQRQTTKHADTLDAFQGVMNHVRQARPTTQLLCGLPFFRCSERVFIQSSEDLVSTALSWFSYPNELDSPQRHTTFPSWTWVGWSGGAKFWRLNVIEARHQPYLRRVRLESPSGQTIVSSTTYKDDMQGELDTVTLVQFNAPMIPATSFSITDDLPDNRHHYRYSGTLVEIPKFRVSGRRLYHSSYPRNYSFEQLVENIRTGIWSCLTLCAGICNERNRDIEHSIFVLVVCWKADSVTAERIDSFCIHTELDELSRLGPVLNGTWTWRRVRLL